MQYNSIGKHSRNDNAGADCSGEKKINMALGQMSSYSCNQNTTPLFLRYGDGSESQEPRMCKETAMFHLLMSELESYEHVIWSVAVLIMCSALLSQKPWIECELARK